MKGLFFALIMANGLISTSWAAGSKHCLSNAPGKPSFCVGEKVIVDEGKKLSVGSPGKIVAIYDDSKKLEIKFKNGSSEILPIDIVADLKEHTQPTGFDYPNQPGLRIMSDTGLIGNIVGKFTNGDAQVSFDLIDNGGEISHRWPMNRLATAHTTYCTTGYSYMCTGDFVAGRNQIEGKVAAVFENTPYVMVRFFGKNAAKERKNFKAVKVNSNDLVVTQSCHDNPLCNHL